jgi:hypothetical protein
MLCRSRSAGSDRDGLRVIRVECNTSSGAKLGNQLRSRLSFSYCIESVVTPRQLAYDPFGPS